MVNYRCWANSERLQTPKSAVKTADSPPAPSGRHAQTGNTQTGKEGRHASRVDLIRRLAREGPPRRFTGTGARVMTTQM